LSYETKAMIGGGGSDLICGVCTNLGVQMLHLCWPFRPLKTALCWRQSQLSCSCVKMLL